jgi:hypothetical protein
MPASSSRQLLLPTPIFFSVALTLNTAVLVTFLKTILFLKPKLHQVSLKDLPTALKLHQIVVDSLIGLSVELLNVQIRVEETKMLELLSSFAADANHEGDLFIGSHDVGSVHAVHLVARGSVRCAVDVQFVEDASLFGGDGRGGVLGVMAV